MRNFLLIRRSALIALVPVLMLAAGLHAVAPLEDDPAIAVEDEAVSWDDVQKLISEQKYQAAAEKVAEIRSAAMESGDIDEWTRALIEEVQLRTALHGYETSVRFLREQPWPDDPTSQAILNLYYAQSLVIYVQAYS
jgi:hypothetical protein